MKKFNLQEAITKRKILPFPDGPKASPKELDAARNDLQDAKDVLKLGKYKLATGTAYYAIFHATRALLFNKKYREKSHIQLALAIKFFYIDKNLLPQEYYDNFIQAFGLREMADYKITFSKEGAERNIQAAEDAIKLAESIFKTPTTSQKKQENARPTSQKSEEPKLNTDDKTPPTAT